uniref:Uncharacterized protein n=1 Tax=Ananas comosus var. bracteatus TaxID=296719 RepID=A0A6V7PXX7_ANACO|nr:unnamed protein product [Ananas comosus var. bracteatus]
MESSRVEKEDIKIKDSKAYLWSPLSPGPDPKENFGPREPSWLFHRKSLNLQGGSGFDTLKYQGLDLIQGEDINSLRNDYRRIIVPIRVPGRAQFDTRTHRRSSVVSACRRPCSPFGALPTTVADARATRTSAKQRAQRLYRVKLATQGIVDPNGGKHDVQHETRMIMLTSTVIGVPSDRWKGDQNSKIKCWNKNTALPKQWELGLVAGGRAAGAPTGTGAAGRRGPG